MRKSGKIALTVLSAAALVVTSVVGTIAYFTDSEAVTNTFIVGQVKMSLDEAKVEPYGELVYEKDSEGNIKIDSETGKPIPVARVQENTYRLIPGHTYTKDPTVHVDGGSENCYVFVTLDNQIEKIEDEDLSITSQMANNGWSPLSDGTNFVKLVDEGTEVPVYAYSSKVQKSTDPNKDIDLLVFSKFQIDGDKVVNGRESDSTAIQDSEGNYYIEAFLGKKVIVKAYAVQADGFESAYKAWDATFGKTD